VRRGVIDKGVPPRDQWPVGITKKLAQWEQGDVVAAPPLFYFADPAVPIWEATRSYTATSVGPEVILPPQSVLPRYGLVTTQTCDISEEDSSRPLRPWVQIAPVYSERSWKRKLERGAGPRYWILIPDIPEEGVWVADLRIEVPVEKGWLAGQSRIVGFAREDEKRRVGRRLQWLRGRPAFSRELNAIHQALYDALTELEKTQPDIHQAMISDLDEIVVQVDSYLAPTHAQLVFLTSATLAEECREWCQQWRDDIIESAKESGIVLQALDFRTSESVTIVEYRKMTSIWQR
jgi:hypothetical protein